MVVGSLPRAQWVRDLVADRTAGKVDEAEADKLLDAAVLFAIRMQENRGLSRKRGLSSCCRTMISH